MNKETLEQAVRQHANNSNNWNGVSRNDCYDSFIAGAKWQAERSYSEEEVMDILYKHTEDLLAGKKMMLDEWFNQFKK